jgi:hypothetical protein
MIATWFAPSIILLLTVIVMILTGSADFPCHAMFAFVAGVIGISISAAVWIIFNITKAFQ